MIYNLFFLLFCCCILSIFLHFLLYNLFLLFHLHVEYWYFRLNFQHLSHQFLLLLFENFLHVKKFDLHQSNYLNLLLLNLGYLWTFHFALLHYLFEMKTNLRILNYYNPKTYQQFFLKKKYLRFLSHLYLLDYYIQQIKSPSIVQKMYS